MQLQCVNSILRGQTDLQYVKEPLFKYHPKLPTAYIMKKPGVGTIMVFTSGKFRAMGRNITKEYIHSIIPVIGDIIIQSKTFVGDLGRSVNLVDMDHLPFKMYYEAELIGYRTIYMDNFNGPAINVFSTGKIIALGNKSKQDFENFIDDIFPPSLINL